MIASGLMEQFADRNAAEFCCNGTVVESPELGQVIQLQGDQRKNVSSFLVANKLAKKVQYCSPGSAFACLRYLWSVLSDAIIYGELCL